MTQVALFGRAYALTLSSPTSAFGLSYGNTVTEQSALRVRFEVKQAAKDTPNTAKITIFNLNPTNRQAIYASRDSPKNYRVKLQAGYQGIVDTLFYGVCVKATTKRDGPDITTELEAIDGQDALLNASFNQKYPQGTATTTILADVARAMDVQIGVVLGLPNTTLRRSQTFSGGCRQVLKDCLRRYGVEFNVLNNKLNMMPRGMHLGKAAVVVSSASGMTGVPSITDEGVTFESLLNPKLVPGQLVQVQSQNAVAAGFFKVRSASFEGDSHADAWKVTCECVRLPDATIQTANPARGFDFAQAQVVGLI